MKKQRSFGEVKLYIEAHPCRDDSAEHLFDVTISELRPRAGTDEEKLWIEEYGDDVVGEAMIVDFEEFTAEEMSSSRRFRVAVLRKTGVSFPPVSSDEFDQKVHEALRKSRGVRERKELEEKSSKKRGAAPAE